MFSHFETQESDCDMYSTSEDCVKALHTAKSIWIAFEFESCKNRRLLYHDWLPWQGYDIECTRGSLEYMG